MRGKSTIFIDQERSGVKYPLLDHRLSPQPWRAVITLIQTVQRLIRSDPILRSTWFQVPTDHYRQPRRWNGLMGYESYEDVVSRLRSLAI